MSFFDEEEEPRTTTRTATRRSRPARGGGRPPSSDPQTLYVRRAVALGVLVLVFIAVIFGVRSCQISARNDALKEYNSRVYAVIQDSVSTSRTFFGILTSATTPSSAYTSINEARLKADSDLHSAQKLSTPDQLKTAHQDLLLTLQMRRDGIAGVGQNITSLSGAASKDAITAIATQMARFYGSDVLYKDYTLPLVLGALRAANIAVGGSNGQQFDADQFLPDIRWLDPTFVASQLHVSYTAPGAPTKVAPGLHGHSLTSVNVAGTTLDTASTNTIPSTPAPTFTLNFSNTGQNQETNVVCQVTVSGTSSKGQTTVPTTTPGQQASCDVPLSPMPARGTYQVTATVKPVPGEKNTANNSQTYSISFQ